jgi:hypothetical protein
VGRRRLDGWDFQVREGERLLDVLTPWRDERIVGRNVS